MTRRLSLCLTLALAVGCASKVKPPTAVVSVAGDVTSFVTGTLVQVDGSKSTDPQNLTLEFRWSLRSVPAGSAAKLNATDVVSPSFLADVTGEYEVALVVSDGIYSSGTVSLIVTAEPCGGHAPQVSKVTFTQGTTTTSSAFAVVTDDAGTPDVPDAGDVTDGGGVDAGPVDAGPVDAGPVDAGPRDAGPQPLFREVDTVKLSATIVDADTDPKSCSPAAPAIFTYQWSLQTPEGSQATLDDPTTATPTFNPDVPGNYIAAVQATDLSGRTGPVVFTTLKVAECGDHAPTVTLATTSVQARVNGALTGNGTAGLDTPISLVATGSDIDNGVGPVTQLNCNPTGKNNQAVTIDWAFVSVPFGSHAVIGAMSTPAIASEPVSSTAIFYPDVAGNYVVRLSGSDSTGRPADPTVIVINVGCAHPPVAPSIRALDSTGAILGNGQTTVGQPVALQTVPTDADNMGSTGCMLQTFTYEWSLTAQPAGSRATLNNPTAAMPGFIADALGTYTARVVVTDSTGLASQPITFNVVAVTSSNACGGRSPTLTTLSNQAVTVNWRQIVQLEADNLLINQNPSCGTGCARLFTADDADSACVSGLRLGFHWSFDSLPSGSQSAFFNPDVQNPSFIPDVANADYVVRLTVTDNRGLTNTATARLHTPAQGANAPQVIFNSAITTLAFTAANGATPATISGGHVGEAAAFTLSRCASNNTQAQVTDADNSSSVCSGTPGPQTFSYNWTVVSAPAGSSAPLLNATTSNPSIVPDVEGAYRFRVMVTDSTGQSSDADDLILNVGCGASVKPVLSGISVTPGGTAVVGVAQQLSVSVSNVDSSSIYTVNGTRVCAVQEQFSYEWNFVTLPAGSTATLNNPTARQPAFVPDVASGTWIVAVKVTDLEGRTTSATTTVSTGTCGSQNPSITNVIAGANANGNPTVTWDGNGNVSSGSALFQQGLAVSFNASARDNDNTCGAPTQTLTYSWALQSLPAGSGATLVSSGATASIVPDVPSVRTNANDYKVMLTVTDSTGRSTTSIFGFSTSTCGDSAPSTQIGTVDCSLPANATICSAPSTSSLSGSAAYTACTGGTTNCLSTSASVHIPLGNTFLLGSLTTPANFSCLPTDTWGSMDYAWQLLSVPNGANPTLTQTSAAGAYFRTNTAGTYVVALTVQNELGLSDTSSVTLIAP